MNEITHNALLSLPDFPSALGSLSPLDHGKPKAKSYEMRDVRTKADVTLPELDDDEIDKIR